MKRLGLLASCLLLLTAATVQEPASGVTFPDTLQCASTPLTCTGVGLRMKLFFKIYAIAHYGDPAAAPKVDAPQQRLDGWIAADAAKAFTLKFTYDVPKEKMIAAWSEGFDGENYHGPERQAFVDAFTTDLPKGTELRFVAEPGGALTAEKDGKSLGHWQAAPLVKALWSIWMGPHSPLGDKNALVSR